MNGGGDDGDVFGKDDLLEGPVVGDVGKGMPEHGIGADPVGNFAGSVFDLPGGDKRGLLDRGEEVLLLPEDGVGLTALGNIAEEEDDAVVEGAALDGEPEIEGVGVEGLELTGDTFVHGAAEVMENFAVLGCDGELLPEIFSEDLAFGAKQLFGAAIEEGDVPVAVDAGDGVGGGLEDLTELADGGVTKELGAFAVGDVAGKDNDAIFIWASGHLEPDVERFRVVGLELGGDAPLHGSRDEGRAGRLPCRLEGNRSPGFRL